MLFRSAQSATTIGNSTKPGSPASVISIPQGNFTTPDVAQTILDAQLTSLKEQLTQMVPGNAVYTSIELHYVYFQGIDNALKAGSTVQNSIVEGLLPLTTDHYNLSVANLNLLRQTAIDLLKA